MIPDEAAYHYMKYYGKLDVSLEEKEQLVKQPDYVYRGAGF